MEHDFWHRRWAKNEIGFHAPFANPLLLEHFAVLDLPAHSRVFLPLCGKSLDIGWLLKAGYHVVGAELSEVAIQQLFAELEKAPTISSVNASLKCFAADGLTVFVGDIFALDSALLGPVDAIYDRAALVALPVTMRSRYASHLTAISQCAPQLLISFDYEQSQLPGPPFAVLSDELSTLYASHYRLQQLAHQTVPGGLKGQCPAEEVVWHLKPA